VACGLALDDEGFDFSVLTHCRTRLRWSERPERIFDAVRSVIEDTGVLKDKTRGPSTRDARPSWLSHASAGHHALAVDICSSRWVRTRRLPSTRVNHDRKRQHLSM
jgi:hypothetical protein